MYLFFLATIDSKWILISPAISVLPQGLRRVGQEEEADSGGVQGCRAAAGEEEEGGEQSEGRGREGARGQEEETAQGGQLLRLGGRRGRWTFSHRKTSLGGLVMRCFSADYEYEIEDECSGK